MFSELSTAGLIGVRGPDAAAFLQAQLTSDVAALPMLHTQYSGYCSPKGRVLATFIVWNLPDAILLQLPAELREPIQIRLKKYVLRAKVELSDATAAYRLFGVWHALERLHDLAPDLPKAMHEVTSDDEVFVARVPGERFLVLTAAGQAPRVRAVLSRESPEEPPEAWMRLDIAAAIPVITAQTHDAFIPQMLNLDALGAVSYSKGCYPGQEIVARTRYLGRLKQRLYPVRIASRSVSAGDTLYSAVFGAEQATGTVVNAVAESAESSRALAVIQTAAAGAELHWKSLDGPPVQLEPLPYTLPQ
ncbi:MAG TPA: folate-binding protein [Burkholderiales bacterium]|nr:folate-binding protein [Burkholderiales bacterium]